MNWLWFRAGFLIGAALGLWSLLDGAMAIRSVSDVAACGLIYGVWFDVFCGPAVRTIRKLGRRPMVIETESVDHG